MESGGEVGTAMAEPRIIEPDDAGSRAPGVAPPPEPDAVVHVLHPGAAPAAPPVPPALAEPIAWLAPADPGFVVLRDDLRDDLYDDLRDDLRDDLYDDLRDDLRADLKTDLDHDLDRLRTDLYDEVDDLREDVFLDGDEAPATALPVGHYQRLDDRQRTRARRVGIIAASVLALSLIAAIVLLWQRSDTALIEAARPAPEVVAPPDLDNVISHVDQLDQQLVGLLTVSASPSTPTDVSLQIEALRDELAGVKGCLQAVRKAIGAGVDTASAIEYC